MQTMNTRCSLRVIINVCCREGLRKGTVRSDILYAGLSSTGCNSDAMKKGSRFTIVTYDGICNEIMKVSAGSRLSCYSSMQLRILSNIDVVLFFLYRTKSILFLDAAIINAAVWVSISLQP